MMRLLIAGLLVIAAAAPLAAQRSEPASPESIRPQDTEPSIPVASPTIDPRSDPSRGAPSTSGAAAGSPADGAQSGPDTPVSSSGDVEPEAAAGAGTGAVHGGDERAQPGRLPAGALPERASSPRTLRAHTHVYIAFAVVWALLFGYAISLGRRFSRLEEEVRRLRG